MTQQCARRNRVRTLRPMRLWQRIALWAVLATVTTLRLSAAERIAPEHCSRVQQCSACVRLDGCGWCKRVSYSDEGVAQLLSQVCAPTNGSSGAVEGLECDMWSHDSCACATGGASAPRSCSAVPHLAGPCWRECSESGECSVDGECRCDSGRTGLGCDGVLQARRAGWMGDARTALTLRVPSRTRVPQSWCL